MIATDADHRHDKYSKRAAWRIQHIADSVRRAVARCIRTNTASSSSSGRVGGGSGVSPVGCPCPVESVCGGARSSSSSSLLSLQSMSLALSLLALVLLYVVHVAGVEHMQRERHDMQEDVRQQHNTARDTDAAARRAQSPPSSRCALCAVCVCAPCCVKMCFSFFEAWTRSRSLNRRCWSRPLCALAWPPSCPSPSPWRPICRQCWTPAWSTASWCARDCRLYNAT